MRRFNKRKPSEEIGETAYLTKLAVLKSALTFFELRGPKEISGLSRFTAGGRISVVALQPLMRAFEAEKRLEGEVGFRVLIAFGTLIAESANFTAEERGFRGGDRERIKRENPKPRPRYTEGDN